MSERLNLLNPEHHEALPAPERQERLPEHAETVQAETAEQRSERLSEARQSAQEQSQHAARVEQLPGAEQFNQPADQERREIDGELKAITARRELQMIRRHLSAPQRTLSKVIHQPVVSAISEGAGKTVSRPSGLLGGGLVALIGTSGYLYLAHHIGFRYNAFVFLLLFAAGFCFGLLLELLVHVVMRGRHARDQ
jgi:hypothetical protein